MNVFPEQEQRCRHRQGMCGHRREGEGGMNRGAQTYMCHMCELDGQREAATDTQHRALSSVLGDDLERRNWVGEAQEGCNVCTHRADSLCCMAETNTTF